MTTPSVRRQQIRALAGARGLWGLIYLLRPGDVVRAAGGRPDKHSTTFARVLGARELLQATATVLSPTAGPVRVGSTVDILHALSMGGLAVLDRTRRRPALLNALTATGWVLLGHAVTRPAAHPPALRAQGST